MSFDPTVDTDFPDVTTINVTQPFTWTEPITVQVRTEDGDLWDCNHHGATLEPVDSMLNEASEDILVCDKCHAWLNDLTGEWIIED